MVMKRLLIFAAVIGLLGGLTVAQEAAEPRPAPAIPGDYVIGREDVLGISVWGEPELSYSLTVRPDGKVSLPLINDVSVAGLTPEQVRVGLEQRYAKFLREPAVTVIVEQFNSFRIYLLGEVNTQGIQAFKTPTRLLQALAAAGGLTKFAKNRITILRVIGGVEKRIYADYKRLTQAQQENLMLEAGDVILVD